MINALFNTEPTPTPVPNGAPMLKDVVVIETLIGDNMLGTLNVWCAMTVEQQEKGLRPTHYFWRDAGSPQGFGPFPRLYDTMAHYANTCKVMKELANPPKGMGKVIQVDFTNKYRLS